MKKPTKHFALTLALCLQLAITGFAVSACTPNPHQDNSDIAQARFFKLEGQTMGTSYHITLQTSEDKLADIQAFIDQRLLDINKSMSTYDDTAAIMAFNRAKAGEKIVIDPDFVQVLKDSYHVYEQSDGAFDPTVMPLVNLWGFGAKTTLERLQSPPSNDEIQQAKALIGLDKVVLDGQHIYKDIDGVGLDFSAIAKGYAVDVIANALSDHYQIANYMVEIGGEVRTAGKNDKNNAWRIAIDTPILNNQTNQRQILTTLNLNNQSIATSGNYRNSVEYNGVRYSHTINPTTAQPVVNGAPSVTVMHDTVALADAWATALTALPYDDAYQMAERANIAALFIIKDTNHDGWQIVKTTAMQQTPQD